MLPIKIEERAVIAIMDLINKSNILSIFASINDKEPSWDGHVYLYGNENLKKENLSARIPIQIKGQENNDFLESTIKYSEVELSDLKNYQSSYGVIYFVIRINEERETKIYYNSLLPLDLEDIIAKKGHQGKTTLDFSPLPVSDYESVFHQFVHHQNLQASGTKLSIDVAENIEFVVQVEADENIFETLNRELKKVNYLYGNVPGVEGMLPIGKQSFLTDNQLVHQVSQNIDAFAFEVEIKTEDKDKYHLATVICIDNTYASEMNESEKTLLAHGAWILVEKIEVNQNLDPSTKEMSCEIDMGILNLSFDNTNFRINTNFSINDASVKRLMELANSFKVDSASQWKITLYDLLVINQDLTFTNPRKFEWRI